MLSRKEGSQTPKLRDREWVCSDRLEKAFDPHFSNCQIWQGLWSSVYPSFIFKEKRGVLKTYVVSCAMYYVICMFSIFLYFAALGCGDIPNRPVAILQLGRKTTFKLYQLTPEEFCSNSLSRTIESSLCGSIGP